MSNNELYYEQLTDLAVRIAVGLKNRTQPLDELTQALTQLSQTGAIKGNAADAMKAYINEVHMTLIQTLQLLLNNYEMALGKYVKGYLEVDSNESFKLVKEDLDAHERNLSSHRSDFTSLGEQLKAISNEAEDIIWLGGAGGNRLINVANEMDVMKKTVSDLKDRWNSYEQTDPGFNQVQDLIAQTNSLLKSTLSVPRGYSYSPGSFSNLMSKDFLNALQANVNYAQNPDNQKAFQDDWKTISKDYTADQKRIAEAAEAAAKKKAQEDGLIGLIWDGLQVVGGAVIAAVGLGLTPFTGGFSLGLTVLGGSMVVGGVNSAINHASMAATGKGLNLIGNLTTGVGQWYNKTIGKSLGQTGVGGFVNGFVSGAGEAVSGMAQFSLYDTGKAVHTLATNPEARAQLGASIGNWWNQIRSGNAYVAGQSTAVVASLLVGGEDIGAAVGNASKADSLLGKAGAFTKSLTVSSVDNAKNLVTLPGRTLDNLGSKFTDLRTALSQGNGLRYAFAGAGDGRSVLSMAGREADALPKNEVQMNFIKEMSQQNKVEMRATGSSTSDLSKGNANGFVDGESEAEELDNILKVSRENPYVKEIESKTSIEGIRNSEAKSFEEDFIKALDAEGLTMDEYISATHTNMKDLSEDMIKKIDKINQSVEMPNSDTLMSKVIPENAYKNCINNGDYSDTVGNCLTRAQDMQDCYSYDDYYKKLGLNYINADGTVSVYTNTDTQALYIERFTSEDTADYVVHSYGGNTDEDLKMAQKVLGLDDRTTFKMDSPYLGTGVTKDIDGEIGKLEFMTKKGNFCQVSNEAAIYKLERGSSKEILSAVRIKGKWYEIID